MSTLQPYLWYIQGFVKKYKTVIFLSTAIGVGIFIVLPSLLTRIPFGKPTRYMGRVGSFSLSKLPRDIQELVSFGLTDIDSDGRVVPALASAFRVEEDGKSYRFTLRPDVKWQDGNIVTPQDVNYNFSNIEIVRSPSDIVYRLSDTKTNNQASENFLPSSFPAIVSQPLFKQVTTKDFFIRKKTIIYGLGKYRISNITYRGPAISDLTLDSNVDRIVYRFYPTEHDAIVSFKEGRVDTLENMQDIEDLEGWNTIRKHIIERSDQYLGIFFNLGYQVGDDHPFANKQLRVALNYALQKPQGNDRILSPIYKKSWGYVGNEEDLDHFDQDLKTAVDTYLKANLFSPISIELTTIPSYADQAEAIKNSWIQLGSVAQATCQSQNLSPNCSQISITVNVRITNVPDLSNFQVLLVGQQIPPDPDQYAIWHSTQPTNFTHYKNARVDKLLEDGRKATDREERKLLYQEFQRLLVKESPAIFLSAIQTFQIDRKSIF